MENCPFCNIDKEKARIIREGKYSYICFSNPRLMPGHLLVIPKRHVERMSELKKEEKEEMIDLTVEYQEIIITKLTKGCDVRQNYRPFVKEDGLKVDHLHIHLQPREFEDEVYKKSQVFEKEIFEQLSEEEINNIKAKLL